MKIVVSHPTGNANVRGLLNGLHRHDLLASYATTLGFSSDEWWYKQLPAWLKRNLKRRSYNLPEKLIKRRPWVEIRRLAIGHSILSGKNSGNKRSSVDKTYNYLDNYVANLIAKGSFPEEVKAIYGYEDGCRDSFRAARSKGWDCFYELPIGYWRAARIILEEEAELSPEWAVTIPALSEPEEKLERKDDELRLATHIFVASSFTLQTLDYFPEKLKRISVIPYGAPNVYSGPQLQMKIGGPLRVLFVGGLSQRKGLSYLFDAVEGLGAQVKLTVIGRVGTKGCQALQKHLDSHDWIESLPHSEVLKCMRNQDVLVFPSLFEGFGLVILEALSQGLPVITTPHTAGPDILSEGEDGFIVPIRSAMAIKEKLELLHRNRDLLLGMKEKALKKAQQMTWQIYEDAISQKVVEVIGKKAG